MWWFVLELTINEPWQGYVDSVDAIFAALEDWVRAEGARGCLFLRTLGETGGETAAILEAVMAHKAAVRARIAEIVATDVGDDGNAPLADQIVILFEGATAAAAYRGTDAVAAARAAAEILVARARP